jgi:hypothetical protein
MTNEAEKRIVVYHQIQLHLSLDELTDSLTKPENVEISQVDSLIKEVEINTEVLLRF